MNETPTGEAGTLRFGYPGDGGLGDRLIAAVLSGRKTATSSLAVEYLSGEPLPRVGQRLTVVDHNGTVHGTVETVRVRIIPLHEVGDEVAASEGEGYRGVDDWRRGHERFWRATSGLVRTDSGDEDWVLREAEPVVVHWFRLVSRPAADEGRRATPPRARRRL
jgi:uncharacterized protein YhfF